LTDDRYQRSQFHAEQILKEYPPQDFVIIGLGRTTGLVSERLRQLSKSDEYVVEIPVENLSSIILMSHEEQDRFFKKILPSPKKLHGRRLVLHRVLWHGMTLRLIGRHLLRYLMEYNYVMPLHGYFITDREAGQFLFIQNRVEDSFIEKIKARFVVDLGFQRNYREELDSDSYVKGLTRIGKYIQADPYEIIRPDFEFKLNPSYSILVALIQADLKVKGTLKIRCTDLFTQFKEKIF